MPRVWIPALARDLTADAEIVDAQGCTVREVVGDLDRRFPGLSDRLCQQGALKPGLAVVVGSEVARRGLDEPVAEASEIHFVRAIAGGSSASGP